MLYAWALAAQRATGGRVTHTETIHLTLAFLGEVEEGAVTRLKNLSVNGEEHRLPIEQARYWPHNRIVWAGPDTTPKPLQAVVSALDWELKQAGLKTEGRRFSAHITLIRKARDPGTLPPLPEVSWPVEEFVLVRSGLSPEGSRYEVIERFALKKPR